MRKPPAFQFYAGEFISGTCGMDCSEVGAYIRLLCFQWDHGAVPNDRERQQRIAGCEVSDYVLSKFRVCEDGQLRNSRMESVRSIQEEFIKIQQRKGLLSGEARRRHGRTPVQPRLNPGSTPVEPRFDSGSIPVHTGFEPNTNSLSLSLSLSSKDHVQGGAGGIPDDRASLAASLVEQLNRMFNRKPDQHWTHLETHTLVTQVANRPDCLSEFQQLAAFKPKRGQYFPHSIGSLLEKWSETLDAARNPDTFKNGSPSISDIRSQKTAIEEVISSHPANPQSAMFKKDASPEKRDELRQLRLRRDGLTRQLAGCGL